MNNVQFEDRNIAHRKHAQTKKHGRLMKFLLSKGMSETQARNTLATVAIVAFLLSLFFWF